MRAGAPVAALPMYDYPEIAAANDALWANIAARLRALGVVAPGSVTRGRSAATLWRDPGLLFGQTCGYPYMKGLRDALVLIATPQYSFPGCEGAAHRSLVIRRAGDSRGSLESFRGAVAAVNGFDSNTGMNLFRATIAPIARGARFFGGVVITGSHQASLEAVADGRADLAAFVYPGLSLAMVRSFAEHRAALEPNERTAIVERAPILGLLFLYNNLHVAHHLRGRLPWYRLPAFYRLNRTALITHNGGLVYRSYFEVARRYLLTPHDRAVHPDWDSRAA